MRMKVLLGCFLGMAGAGGASAQNWKYNPFTRKMDRVAGVATIIGGACSSGQVMISISTLGVPACAQLSFSQLSGTAGVTTFTFGTIDPSGVCVVGVRYHRTNNDTTWDCNDGTWSQVITDGGSWVNPSWIVSLAWAKITGAPTIFTGGGTLNKAGRWTGAAALGDFNLSQHASTGAIQHEKGTSYPAQVVASSATPNFDLSLSDNPDNTLTANATFSFSNPPASPATIKFFRITWRQNATGGWTVTCPGTVLNCIQPDPNPLAITVQILQSDGTNYATIASNCISNCSSGTTTWYGKTSGLASWGVKDTAGTPLPVKIPSIDPTVGQAIVASVVGADVQLGWGTASGGSMIGEWTGTLDFGNALDLSCAADLTIAATGLTVGIPLIVVPPAAANSGMRFFAWASAADVAKVRACNFSGADVDLASGSFVVKAARGYLSAAGTIDWANIPAGGQVSNTVTVTGATTAMGAIASVPAALDAGLDVSARVTAADTVTITLFNGTVTDIDPASGSFVGMVIQ